MNPDRPTTRLAPSPTGALHLGNARTFLVNWAMARRRGWRIVLRMEDIDTPRTKLGADRMALDDLTWLGLDWDAGPTYQLADLSPYEAALDQLRQRGLIYPCRCTRKEIELALSAPHGSDEHETRYPGTCRPADDANGTLKQSLTQEDDRPAAWRVRGADEAIVFDDLLCGRRSVNIQQSVGDFVVSAKTGLPAYQLAVVVDDARQQVTHVVRGDDLLNSTARQIWLYRLLDLGAPPTYCHLALVLGEDGRRLAKRHGDTRVQTYREQGVAATRLIGLLAFWCGVIDNLEPMAATQFCEMFDLDRLPRQPVTFDQECHQWLID